MAKSQKKSNREIRKPKQDKPKTEAVARSFLGLAERGPGSMPSGKKAAR
ncbi:MAG TPA: hypothetical protein VFH92_01320 [Phenylobacterium sp.]|nr:hypothetical protein [Phenylobacterium sp.]